MSKPGVVGFLGAGKMATSLAKGFIKAGLVEARQVCASDVSPAALEAFAAYTGGTARRSNFDVAMGSSVVILAVKPDQIPEVLSELKPAASPNPLLISIAAGVTIARLESLAWTHARVVRVMPNTPALVGESASAFALGARARPADAQLVASLFGSVGIAMEVKESLLDAVTGLSGSGPAYVFQIIEALSDGGVAVGLPRDVSTRLAAQTLLGAARMVLETGQHPGQLKDAVCSPGGTTIEAIHELEKGGLRATLINAVRAAAEKAKKLGAG